MPTLISFEDGNKISYLYNAAGQKVRKILSPPDEGTKVQTDYFDGFQYTDTVLNFFPHSEGYVNVTYCSTCEEPHYLFDYVFNYLDHLGNVRVSYGYDTTSQTVKILEENHYYAFGLKHTHYNVDKKEYKLEEDNTKIDQTGGALLYKYKYNGKEWQDEVGLNMYAMDMRQYDPAIARWVAQDPVVHYDVSPYSAFDNNPVLHADPSGADTNTMMGTDVFGNTRYNQYGGYVPMYERPDDLVQSAMQRDIEDDSSSGNSFTGNNDSGGENIKPDINYWLTDAKYAPNDVISGMAIEERTAYIQEMINRVLPAKILYAAAGNVKGYYDKGTEEFGYTDKNVEGIATNFGSRAFQTNYSLFYYIMHEGMHAWDTSQKRIDKWKNIYGEKKAIAIKEMRAYEMSRWFNNGKFFNDDDTSKYSDAMKWLKNMDLRSLSIQSYPMFFNNIQH